MKRSSVHFATVLIALGAMVGRAPHSQAAVEPLSFDTPTEVGGVEVVCTGIGLEAREDARWSRYPLKVEIAGKGGQYLGDVHLALTRNGQNVLTVTCGGPRVLFRLPAARYQVDATAEGKTVSSSANVPATGQGRIILRFPELGGALETPPEPSDETKTEPETKVSNAQAN
jgi:hypothetical protein